MVLHAGLLVRRKKGIVVFFVWHNVFGKAANLKLSMCTERKKRVENTFDQTYDPYVT